ncbi:hypothetical protein P7D85_10260 [Enterococcus hulanensis]|uniref:Uncharacterized protein n=1 Tax=Enterococcus hulanensis TaxID=2559929 RepID=A0ABU3EZ57_9ENTE|nr:hypothetical protein [Enterococcus hulanensis]MDT2600157.1 hypothetical protein [Enterococcus hulanensis]MDT2608970.1 hypothetical protein [Enterococcus hulanensis]MDT2616988.1 hypothetical protein [Enterococcus hulanensis]MDT2628492.1 hypothetical protein [Enterococcus hulanensis]MDT2655832.1 hypothetical protein [Enterococcus hulanensis]
MGFFRVSGVNAFISGALLIFALLSMYAMGSSIFFLFKEILKKNDELVRKTVFDAMAMSFVVIILLHIVQMIIRVVHFNKTGQDINLVVTPGLAIYKLGDAPLHLESVGVDLGIFAICLLINRLRYRL